MRNRTLLTGVSRRGWGLKVFALAFALLQLGLQELFPVSDGYDQAASALVPPVHIERPGNRHHPLHDEADCAVCHVIAAASLAAPTPTPLERPAERTGEVRPAELSWRISQLPDGARRARAPPLTV